MYSLRIPVERLEQLRRLAEERGEAPTGILRRWVLERLDQELACATATQPTAGFEQIFDPTAVHELERLVESVPPSRQHLVREQLKGLHHQLLVTVGAFVDVASGNLAAPQTGSGSRR